MTNTATRTQTEQPTITHHPSHVPSIIRTLTPGPSLIQSVAGAAAHFSDATSLNEQHHKYLHREESRRSSGGTISNGGTLKHRRKSSSTPAGEQNLELYKAVLDDLEELYECRVTREIMERRWRRDAEFEDPLALCQGWDEIAPQWFAMPRIFTKSTTLSRRILQSTDDPKRLIFYQKQEYVARITRLKKIVESVIIVDLDGEDKIVRMVDQWDGKEPPTRWGAAFLRRTNGRLLPWMPWLGHVPRSSR